MKKRAAAFLTAAAMAVSYAFAFAEDSETNYIEISGKNIPGYTLTVPEEYTNVEWIRLSEPSGTGETVGTGNSYTLVNDDGKKYIKAVAEQGESEAKQIEQAMSDQYPYTWDTRPIAAAQTAERVLWIDDRQFTILDVTDDGDYYMLADEVYGANSAIDTTKAENNFFKPRCAKFEETKLYNDLDILYRGGTLSGPAGFSPIKLPQNIIDYINPDTEWLVERGAKKPYTYDGIEYEPTIPNDYIYTAPLSLLSVSDMYKYKDIVAKVSQNTWMRSPSTDEATGSKSIKNQMYMSGASGAVASVEYNAYIYLRPVFCLNPDFFREVSVDVGRSGELVLNQIENLSTLDEMREKELYTEEELAKIYHFTPLEPPPTEERDILKFETMRPGETVGLEYIPEDEDVEYSWYLRSDGLDTRIKGEVSGSITLLNDWAGKELFCKITSPELIIETTPHTVEKPYFDISSKYAPGTKFTDSDSYSAEGPSENKFVIGGKSFSLLDTNKDGEFLILANDPYGNGAVYDETGLLRPNAPRYSAEDEKSIGYKVNRLYYGDNIGTYSALPQSIRDSIVPDKTWYIERSGRTETKDENGNAIKPSITDDYTIKASVVLPAAYEIILYADKFGYGMRDMPLTWTWSWWTRTSYATENTTAAEVQYKSMLPTDGTIATNVYSSTTIKIRPMFWLDKDFFRKAKLNLQETGDEIKNMLLSLYSFDEIYALYGNDIRYLNISVLEGVKINGIPAVGNVLTSDYTGDFLNGETAENVKYEWQSASSMDGEFTAIAGVSGTSLELNSDLQEKYIRLKLVLTTYDGKEIPFYSAVTNIVEEAQNKNEVKVPSSGGGGGSSSSGGRVSSGTVVSAPSATAKPLPSETDFVDLDNVEWARDAILTLKSKGIINGVDNSHFAPEMNVKREEFIKMIIGAFNIESDGAECNYIDVDRFGWYCKYVETATNAGIVNGISESIFGVGNEITRQDMAVIAYRTLKVLGAVNSENEKTDISDILKDYHDISDYAAESISYLYKAGIISGMGDGSFEPKRSCTRAEATKLMYSLMQYYENI